MNLVCARRRRAAKGPAKPSARGAGWGRRSPVVALGLWESERAHAAEREQENQASFSPFDAKTWELLLEEQHNNF